mmetsp:Transcript_18772/g.35432  ORF Transcript_18772/g.35432 Transcript_18772/m.35432 type:complete len:332 (-) Transcript_18772:190-1185(-)|eukprot:CAMPEP_0170177738 /NCGR_PEP_ID=MMETSP0040_2-20121228/10929_1 /TAXON_ID=641309 /ORGANISM="Lotharella oceanica, Strain CCMP622" /LENGTH=331 /DNA_ID=CAMNT_0010420503 /DNA_START=53 /DNA_END=1048 /DNA_ORIENTATION=+
MIRSATSRIFSSSRRSMSTVAVVGSAGGIGQPLAMLMKLNPLVSDLRLYDVVPLNKGVAADVSHIATPAKCTGYVGDDEILEGLSGCDMVIVPAGVPRKPGMTRDDLFNVNANIVKSIAEACSKACPKAMLCIISNPVNSTVPIIAETLKKAGTYDPKRLFGVTTLDLQRARTFVAENQGFDVNETCVSVIGGHAGKTILPLLSQVKDAKFSDADRDALTHRIMFGGDEVVKAKAGGGSATLSMAYAGAEFADALLKAMNGEAGIVQNTYVESDLVPGCTFFSTPVSLGPNGAEEVHPFGELSDYEQKLFDEMLPELQGQIQKGVDFVAKA